MSAYQTTALIDNEQLALMKFRQSVQNILKPEHDDHYLLRWLRARQFNIENAEKMFRESMKWREKWEVDSIEDWKAPKLFENYSLHGTPGCDREGSVIIIIPFAGIDMWGLLHSASKNDITKYTIRSLERYMKMAYEQSKIYGPEARKFLVIIDMDNFSMKQYAYRPAAQLVVNIIQLYSNNYPEILKYCCIINAPKIFTFAFNIVKEFLDDYTLSKISIFKRKQSKWLPAILEKIDPKSLPKYFGGDLIDSTGDSKCEEVIGWGGKIPKEFYITNEGKYNNESTYQTTIVKKGSKLKLHFDVKESGVLLKWDFMTDNEIKFGVQALNMKTNEKFYEVDLKRINAHEQEEIGFIECQADHKYTVIFDNSYNFFKSKLQLTYSVVVTTPFAENEKSACKIEEKIVENVEPEIKDN